MGKNRSIDFLFFPLLFIFLGIENRYSPFSKGQSIGSLGRKERIPSFLQRAPLCFWSFWKKKGGSWPIKKRGLSTLPYNNEGGEIRGIKGPEREKNPSIDFLFFPLLFIFLGIEKRDPFFLKRPKQGQPGERRENLPLFFKGLSYVLGLFEKKEGEFSP